MNCPTCGSGDVQRSARRGAERLTQYVYPRAPYRCKDCGMRFWVFENPFENRSSKIAAGAAAGVVLLLVVLAAMLGNRVPADPRRTTAQSGGAEPTRASEPAASPPSSAPATTASAGQPSPAASTPSGTPAPATTAPPPMTAASETRAPVAATPAALTEKAGLTPDLAEAKLPGPPTAMAGQPTPTMVVRREPSTPKASPTAAPKTPTQSPATVAPTPMLTPAPVETSKIAPTPVSAKTLTPTAAPTSTPAKPPTASTPAPAVAGTGPAGVRRIGEIKPTEQGGAFSLSIALGGPIAMESYEAGPVPEPPTRYVIDLKGKWIPPASKSFAVGGSIVKQIRVGIHPDKIRLVLDLVDEKMPEAHVETTPQGLVLSLRPVP